MSTQIDNASRALSCIRELAKQGHARDWIAHWLNYQNIPTLSGRPGTRWYGPSVARLAKAHGVVIKYRMAE